MGIWTDWFIAPLTAGASIANDDPSADDRRRLSLKVGDMELMALWAVLRGDDDFTQSALGKLVYQASEEGPFVARVEAAFVAALAELPRERHAEVAAAWRKAAEDYHPGDWTNDEAIDVLSSMTAFARAAVNVSTPVLQLCVM